mmetsp:Transcript_8386/g.17446  ORF Transcript_8386/g.17446 Transcript_8386/m.17446 type:complete len:164 (-) Transcript_8386:45-536(-)|eukprot:CAMPEP_0172456036 /NCGR_PEP_ID=MMETSP1065-20121228/13846_1 /TAXON_ID=265537 /ORGANISM="Amphiprora paludosa, Strain CCMP125" /LENGTH=163 /DNA_ID=CAMNT_0013208653 /DNA_START=67 /DNA_END=558 /DNA_ORIENTATION=+
MLGVKRLCTTGAASRGFCGIVARHQQLAAPASTATPSSAGLFIQDGSSPDNHLTQSNGALGWTANSNGRISSWMALVPWWSGWSTVVSTQSATLFWQLQQQPSCMTTFVETKLEDANDDDDDEQDEFSSIWNISTLKRRRKKMNKHKYKKRRKKLRFRNKEKR